MTPSENLWNTIVIVIVLDCLHKDFNIRTTSLLKTNNKTIDQIQSILQLKKAKNLGKQAIEATGDLVMAFCNRNCNRKREANTDNECYNCYKLGYFSQNCPSQIRNWIGCNTSAEIVGQRVNHKCPVIKTDHACLLGATCGC